MAKRIVDEEMRFTVIVNGNEAQKELYTLEKSTRNLTDRNKELRAERTRLIAQGKKNSTAYRNLTAEIRKNNVIIKANKGRMHELQKEIGITGLTMTQLTQRAAQLRIQLRHMVPGSRQYKKFDAELQKIKTRIKELRNGAQASRFSISGLANTFNKYAALGATIVASLTGVVLSIQKLIDYNGKLSDAQSDVTKTTGLTKKEVDELTKSFGLMQTRTARIELLKLAEEAGRLGIEGVENIKGFIAVANQMKVALRDDLSDKQIREVGKMVNIYQIGQQTGRNFENSMKSLGSAINEVSASGANQAGFLVEYLKRQAGIAAQARIGASENIGYAATFDEIGQSVEVSATAMNKVWMDMFENTKDYAKIAGMTEKAFAELLGTDANAAMIAFLEGLAGSDEGLAVMANKLKDIEVGGARGTQALAALSGNIDLLKKRQNLANVSLIEAQSLTDEYNLKNNNLAATIDKVKKKMASWVSSETIAKGLNDFLIWFGKFIGAVEDSDGEVTRWQNRLMAVLKVIFILTAAIISYNTAVKLTALLTNNAYKASKAYQLITRAAAITQNFFTASLNLGKAAFFLLTGQIHKAKTAMIAFNAVTKLSPVGIVVGLIGAATAAYVAFSATAKEAASKQSVLNDVNKEAAKETAAQVNQLKELLKVARDETQSKERRQQAIDELNKTVPEYNKNLTIESANTQEATSKLNSYIEALKNAAKEKYLKSLVDKNAEELAKAETSSLTDNINGWEAFWNGIASLGNRYKMLDKNIRTASKNKERLIALSQKELEQANKLYQEQRKLNENIEHTGPKEGDTMRDGDGNLLVFRSGKWQKVTIITSDDGKDDNKKGKSVNNAKKEAEELLKIQRDAEDARIALIQDSFKQQLEKQSTNHQRKLESLKKQLIAEEELTKIQHKIDTATTGGDTKTAAALTKTKEQWIKRNAALNQQIEYEEELHQFRMATIYEEGLKNSFKGLEKDFERAKMLRETEHNNQIALLGNNKKAREKLTQEYNQRELEAEEKHLKNILSKYQEFIASGNFEGLDLSILSPEQVQEISGYIDQLKLKLSELGLKKQELTNNSVTSGIAIAEETNLNTDVLGFTIDDWLTSFDNLDTLSGKIELATMAVQSLANVWTMYSRMREANMQQELKRFEQNQETQKQRLKERLDTGFINQKEYDAAIQAMEKEANKKRAEFEYKKAKREKETQIMSGIAGTASAVIGALGSKPWTPANFIFASIVGAMGLAQTAVIAGSKLPAKGYEDGYYANMPVQRKQDGRIYNATYGGIPTTQIVDKPTYFLAGEGGKNFPEMIIDGNSFRQFSPDFKNSLYGEIARVRGYEQGFYQNQTRQPQFQEKDIATDPMLMATLIKTNQLLDELLTHGIEAIVSSRNMQSMRNLKEGIKEYETLRNKNKR